MIMIMSKKFIPIWKFCKDSGINRQRVYRLIREGKIQKEDVEKRKIEVERIFINKDIVIK